MNKIEYCNFKTNYGDLILASFENQLCMCDWKWRKMRSSIDNRIKKSLEADFIESESEIIKITKIQLIEYFNKQRTEFDNPINLIGTDFQKEVWLELLKIPYGKTETYLGLSKKMNKIEAIRAIASANGANAISIIVPCHRIIGSDGELVGYAGGLPVKKKLLELEKENSKSIDELF